MFWLIASAMLFIERSASHNYHQASEYCEFDGRDASLPHPSRNAYALVSWMLRPCVHQKILE